MASGDKITICHMAGNSRTAYAHTKMQGSQKITRL